MSGQEKRVFDDLDSFFESITAISGELRPKWEKQRKRTIINEKL
jgi:hypothetical protein